MGIQKRGYNRSKTTAHIIELPVDDRGRLRPDKLRPEEAAVFNEIVSAMPVGYFGPENEHLLRMLCTAVTTSAVVEQKLAKARDANDLKKLDVLTSIHANTSRVIGNLSSKLKLTPQSRVSQEKASHQVRLGSQTRPWVPK